jgi:DNA-binding NtrC family response regulator
MRQKNTVLLIEDDENLREPNALALEQAGYQVLRASGWEHALTIARERPEQVAVVVTDLVMPGAAGIATFSSLKDFQGPVPVIVLSGYPKVMKLLHGVLDGVVEWLHKPVETGAIVQAVGRAVGNSASSAGG